MNSVFFMHKKIIALKVLALALCLFSWTGFAQEKDSLSVSNLNSNPLFLQDAVRKIYAENKNAIVKVFAAKEAKDASSYLLVGSGFFVGKEGHIITNATVTYGASKLWIEHEGIPYSAELVGLDPITNLSVIKAKGDFKSKDIPIVNIAGKNIEVVTAQMLVTISSEMGQSPSPAFGLVTGHNIRFGEKILPTVYIRTNIPLFGGSCGGAVFSIDGNFVGMTVANIPELGGSFVLPAKAAKRVFDDIILCGEPVYGWFGLRTQELSDSVNGTRVVVDMVLEKGPAKKAGFEIDDIVREVNLSKIKNDIDLRNATFFIRPGEKAHFKVERKGEIINLELLVERMLSDVVNSQMGALELSQSSMQVPMKNSNVNIFKNSENVERNSDQDGSVDNFK